VQQHVVERFVAQFGGFFEDAEVFDNGGLSGEIAERFGAQYFVVILIGIFRLTSVIERIFQELEFLQRYQSL